MDSTALVALLWCSSCKVLKKLCFTFFKIVPFMSRITWKKTKKKQILACGLWDPTVGTCL